MQIIKIDYSQLEKMLNTIGKDIDNRTDRVLQQRLSYRSNILADKLNENAPSQRRHDYRPEFSQKLNESFYSDRRGSDRVVSTSQPVKLSLVTLGTNAHMIRPRFKKALWWPGLLHPVSFVWHPGTSENNFVEETLNEYGIEGDAQVVADMVANAIVSTTEDFKAANIPTSSDWDEGIRW